MKKFISEPKNFGLYYKELNFNEDLIPIPLSKIDINVKIFDSIARTEYSQLYQNPTKSKIEVLYLFPIPKYAAFDSFIAKYQSEIIEGIIMEKKEAEEKFLDSIESNQTAILGRMSEDSTQIMKVQIGNMDPNTSIQINLSFHEQLETSANKYWTYQVLGNLAPKYTPQNYYSRDDSINITNYPHISTDDPKAYPWDIRIDIESKSEIEEIKCPDYDIKTVYTEEGKTASVTLNDKKKFLPSKDFTIYFRDSELNKPKVLLSKNDEEYCAFVSFIPENDEIKNKNAKLYAKEEDKAKKLDLNKVRGEYIFVLDRSGSMKNEKIKMAIQTLVIFLKFLPPNSYFNIVSFGSKFEFLFNNSQTYNPDVLKEAIEKLSKFDADMGGTEILEPLEKIYSEKPSNDYRRYIFLLTDGEVSNTKEVIDLIRCNTESTKVYSVGIGSSCSKELIKGAAEAGQGKCEFVEDNETEFLSEKVMALLIESMSNKYESFTLSDDTFTKMSMIIPDPKKSSIIPRGKSKFFFCFFEEAAFNDGILDLEFFYEGDCEEEVHNFKTQLKLGDCMDDSNPLKTAIHKLGYAHLFKIEEKLDVNLTDIGYYSSTGLLSKEQKIKKSIKNGVLFKETAFLCKFKSQNSKKTKIKPAQIIIPHLTQKYNNFPYSAQKLSNTRNFNSSNNFQNRYTSQTYYSNCYTSNYNYQSPPQNNSKKYSNYSKRKEYKARESDYQRDSDNMINYSFAYNARRNQMDIQDLSFFKIDQSESKKIADEWPKQYSSRIKFCELPQNYFEKVPKEVEEFVRDKSEKTFKMNEITSQDLLFKIISSQNIDGSWDYDENLMAELEVLFRDNLLFANVKDLSDKVELTKVILHLLSSKFNMFSNTWKLIAMKAESFLQSR